ncbi:hypothetical protein OS493_029196 [Desmophyllum pertusum]|uniref:Uncharacterized protein n=1 Tax=Desmophyllum pertusum TaxID=174260 RepID=A0A9X0D9E8_9CNID|nr:hypothetical protein OS493_029196 [Desmophyllum pertusum]
MSHVTGVQKKELCDSSCKVNPLGQSSYVATRSNDHCSAQQREHIAADVKSSRKSNFSFIPRSTLQSSASVRSDNLTTQQVKQHNVTNTNSLVLPQTGIQRIEKEQTSFQNISERKGVEINATRQHNSTEQRMVQRESKAVKYSKEDIERKKLDAQNRRRQKMTQSQHKHHS